MIALFTVAAAVLTSTTAYAHKGDFWDGAYFDYHYTKDLTLWVDGGAQTDLLDEEVYKAGQWNQVSQNVNVDIILKTGTGGMHPGFSRVLGASPELMKGYTGFTRPYGTDGEIVDLDSGLGVHETWTYVEILMNKGDIFNRASNPKAAAKKTFLHEVGHALKLCHPEKNSSLEEHDYDGLPKSIMNRGFPGSSRAVPDYVTYHDRINLIEKWGDEYI